MPTSFNPPPEQLAWAAGLFEGEGCLSTTSHGKRGGGCQMRLGMTDRDVVERFAGIMGCGNISVRTAEEQARRWPRGEKTPKKDFYSWVLYRASDMVPRLEALLPFFGERRAAKAREVLEVARKIVPRNERTHCPQGHPYSGDNLILEPIVRRAANGELRHYTARRCKTCRDRQNADHRAKMGTT